MRHPPSVASARVRLVVRGVTALAAASVLAELFFHKADHVHYGFEALFGFHAAFGFVGCVILVLAAVGVRELVARPEDYYDDAGGGA